MAWWRIIVKVEVLPLEKSDDIFLPFTAWVNRFANAGDATLEAAENTAVRVGSLSLISILPFVIFLIF